METQKQSQSGDRKFFGLLLVLYFLTRLPWIFMVPMVEAPDEFSHFWVINFLVERCRLPEAADVLAGGPSAVYGSLPQLGYLPHVLTGYLGQMVAPAVDISVTSRFGSLFAGVVLLWCSVIFGRKLFGREKLLRWALPAVIVFQPQLVFVNSYANCDSVMASLAALALLLTCNMVESGLKTRSSVALGLTLAWLALTKYPGMAVFPACALGFLFAARINRQSIKKTLAQAAITATLAATCLFWFARNGAIFDGDYLGTQTMFSTWAKTYNRPLAPHISISAVLKQKSFWRMTIFSFWGMFGYMTVYLWRPLYIIYMVLMGTALGGGIKALIAGTILPAVQRLRQPKSDLPTISFMTDEEAGERKVKTAMWMVLATCFLGNLAAMIYAMTKNLGGGQGRYLFPSEIPIIALILGGLYLTGLKARRPLIVFFVIFNIIVYFVSFYVLATKYGFHQFLKTY
jgi:4-amino-4-deoxy-L-arabinose transferase-like glycosyltransferase